MMEGAPREARIVVVGACMQGDQIGPMTGINKHLRLDFVLGYSPRSSRRRSTTRRRRLDGSPMITGRSPPTAWLEAFADLGDPERHAKILVEPWR